MANSPKSLKRRSPSPSHPRLRLTKDHRRCETQSTPQNVVGIDKWANRKEQDSFAKRQSRLNQIQEAEQMKEWASKEDEFVLKQAKKKARVRVKDGRPKLIDWLSVTLSVLEPPDDDLEDDRSEPGIDVVDPTLLLEGLDQTQLQSLSRDIDSYLILETSSRNRKYWAVWCS